MGNVAQSVETVAAWIDEHFVTALAIAGGRYSAMPINNSMT